ncbi:PQQ-binding-like beta-propeller repeat protein [uncultured Draconibacterium sp.]|uniref:outer membrane protein assembly factor BamB family protein n=1 Tax=uncultured Draconibacterium sp. TaxID=1573823 RepID=UPI0029C7D3B4|nr:PQQ-binding-like beta-propeller repeat protein [uncultured Draconibacterium sp.]
MTKRTINIILISIGIIGFISIFWWLNADPTKDFTVNLEGADNRGKGVPPQDVNIGEHFEELASDYEVLEETWTNFRGADHDNISKSPVKLLESFGAEGPKILWSKKLGEGHSGAAIYKGLAYLLDYDEEERADILRCFSVVTGEEQWRRGYDVAIKRNHGMSRTIPAVTEDYIVTIGPKCHVMCLDRETGDFRWGLDVVKEYQNEIPFWYTGQCPLIDNGVAIIATGGSKMMVAVDCETGEKLWETPNPNGWKMSHSSVMPFTFGGRKMYVYSAVGGLLGVAADGPDAGQILWETSKWNHSVVAPSPVCMPDGKIFMTAGYGAGSMMLQLSENNGTFAVEPLYEYAPKEGLACEQQTPIFWNGYLFGIVPKDGGANRNQLICVSPADSRKVVWSSGKETRFGLGPYFIADNKMFILSDDGTLTIARPSTEKYIQLEQVNVIEDGHDAWAPFALADGYLLLRDAETMICIDLNVTG